MTKKLSFFLPLFLLLLVQTMAAPVGRQQAIREAKSFLAQRGVGSTALSVRMQAPINCNAQVATDAAAYYIFNVGNNRGFVIVSGDDRTDAVLGYTTSGDFDESDMPENMRAWLQGYADQISAMDADERALGYNPADVDNGRAARSYSPALRSVQLHDAVAPLITTKWNQGNPYNGMCPEYQADNRSVTGCVATAMAQLMNYYKYPVNLPAIGGYTTSAYSISISALPEVTGFPWNNLKATYSDGETDNNIATLMRYCGQSVEMDYGPSSGAILDAAASALRNVFGYASAEGVSRQDYSIAGWDNIIYEQLRNNRPVFYGGQSTGGRHAFLCDGYDGEGYYHINWGWGGYQDGYFLLSVMNPDGGGIGASSTSDGYTGAQYAIVNVDKTPIAVDYTLTAWDFAYDDANNKLTVKQINWTGAQRTFDYGFGILGETKIDYAQSYGNVTLGNNYYVSIELGVTNDFLTSLPNGTYKVVPICKESGKEQWLNCYKNENVYAEIFVSGGTATFVKMHPVEDLQYSMTVEGNYMTDATHKAKVTIKNNGDEVTKNLVLLYKLSTEDDSKYESASTVCVPVEAGSSEVVVELSFTPKVTGVYNLKVLDADKSVCCTYDVTIKAPLDSYNLTVTDLKLQSGKKPVLTFTITNNSAETYPYDFTAFVGEDDITFAGGNISGSCRTIANSSGIPAGSTKTFTYEIPDFSKDCFYYIIISGEKCILANNQISARFCKASISSFGYATFAKSYPLNFSECADLEAYTGRLNAEKTSLVMTKQGKTPANTGLVLKGTPSATYAVIVDNSASAIGDNDLVAVTADTSVDANSILVLANVDEVVGFYNYTGTTITAGHAYLPKSIVSSASVRVSISWEKESSGIDSIARPMPNKQGEKYNLSGQKVDECFKGIVIMNGRKMLVK